MLVRSGVQLQAGVHMALYFQLEKELSCFPF